MQLIRLLGLMALFMVSAVPSALAQTADGKTPDTAIELTSATSQSGSLMGTRGGAFTYYWIDYPGDGDDVTLTMNFTPSDSSMAKAVGVHVYEGINLRSSMRGSRSKDLKGTNEITFFSHKKVRLLVQVFNYEPREVFFQLILAGLEPPAGAEAPTTPTQPSPAPVEQPQTAAPASGDGATPDKAISFVETASGSLVGDSAGAYAYYWVDNKPGKMGYFQLDFSPGDSTTKKSVAIEAWQGNTRVAAMKGAASPDKGVVKTFFKSNSSTPLVVQVSNYRQGVSIDYRLMLTWK